MSLLCKTAIYERLKQREPLWGSWKITDFIGSGAHGCVYKISKETQGHSFVSALKVIPLTRALDRHSRTIASLHESVGKEANEVLLLYKIGNHQNIVTWYDHDIQYHQEQDSVTADICVRIDYMPNSLVNVMSRGALEWRDALKYLIDCLQGLEHIHSLQIIHRDIKPENIFVTAEGRAKIGDFGVARKMSETTQADTRVGTPLYIAPEVILNPLEGGYGQQVDIYSLGLVGYEMLAGKLPFEDECNGVKTCMVKKRLSGKFVGLDLSFPTGVADAIHGSMAFHPQHRYSSALEFRLALQKALDTNGKETIPPKITGEAPTVTRRAPEQTPAHEIGGYGGKRRFTHTPDSVQSPSRQNSTPTATPAGPYAKQYKWEPAKEKSFWERHQETFTPLRSKHEVTQDQFIIFFLAMVGAGVQYFFRSSIPDIAIYSLPIIYFVIPLFFIFIYQGYLFTIPLAFGISQCVYSYLFIGSISGIFDPGNLVFLILFVAALFFIPMIYTLLKLKDS